jgi:hypothetical protein
MDHKCQCGTEGLHEEVTARAIKRVIARQLGALMHDQGLSKSSLAKRVKPAVPSSTARYRATAPAFDCIRDNHKQC